ncbi:MAG: 3'-5' exonuclease [Acidimicrobiales bacterium]|nr:3'-5' exonuclease [Acidimicrobiales bacterium]
MRNSKHQFVSSSCYDVNKVTVFQDCEYEFVALDFETATSERSSACALGVVFADSLGREVGSDYWLIRPPGNYYLDINIGIHGIYPEQTQESPNFGDLWSEISDLFVGKTLIAHNAPFDKGVLNSTLMHYGHEPVDNTFICSLALARRYLRDLSRYKLSCIANYFEYDFIHHNALEDARACLFVANKSVEYSPFDSIHSAWK